MKNKPAEAAPLQFTTAGRTKTAADLLAAAPGQKARPKSGGPTAYHKGWRVEGHAPGALERSAASNIEAWRQWNSQSPERRIAELKLGRRPPEMWNEERWRTNNKKRPVRARPFEVASAAEQCAEMARKAGWIDVVVVELSAGSAAGLLFGDV